MARSPGRPGPPRLGFVVSRKNGNAVARNRIRRRLRNAVGSGQLQPGNDYVIIANKEVAEAPFTEVKAWIGQALAEINDA